MVSRGFVMGGCAYCSMFLYIMGAAAVEPTLLQRIKNDVEEIRTCYKIPGLAIGVVKDNDTTAFGLGYADMQTLRNVTADTVFGIGSLTKAFTSALMALILPKYSYSWDTPLKEIAPHIRMNNSLLSEHVTLTDLLTHRTGVLEFDPVLMFGYESGVTRQELTRRIQFHEASLPFRTRLEYNNHMYALGGYVAENITGKAWEDLVTERFFSPLRMSTSDFAQSWNTTQNLSKMYTSGLVDDTLELPLAPIEFVVPLGPAGSILSTANDITRWMRFLLDKLNTTDRMWKNMFTPHVPIVGSDILSDFGIGWVKGHYGGEPFWQHSGTIEGFCSLLVLFPKHNLGIFMVANKCRGREAAFQPLARRLMETMLNIPRSSNISAICSLRVVPSAAVFPAVTELRDPCRYEGNFGNLAFGNLTISCHNADLRWSMGVGLGRLIPIPGRENMFAATFEGIRESFNYFPSLETISFSNNNRHVRIGENDAIFVRGLRMQDVPPANKTPEICHSNSAHVTPMAWLLLTTMIIAIFSR